MAQPREMLKILGFSWKPSLPAAAAGSCMIASEVRDCFDRATVEPVSNRSSHLDLTAWHDYC